MVGAARENGTHGRGGFAVPGAGSGLGILRMPTDRIHGSAPVGGTQQTGDLGERNVVDASVGPCFKSSELPPENSRVITATLPDVGASLLVFPVVSIEGVVLMPEHHPFVCNPEQVAVEGLRFRRGLWIRRKRRSVRTSG